MATLVITLALVLMSTAQVMAATCNSSFCHTNNGGNNGSQCELNGQTYTCGVCSSFGGNGLTAVLFNGDIGSDDAKSKCEVMHTSVLTCTRDFECPPRSFIRSPLQVCANQPCQASDCCRQYSSDGTTNDSVDNGGSGDSGSGDSGSGDATVVKTCQNTKFDCGDRDLQLFVVGSAIPVILL